MWVDPNKPVDFQTQAAEIQRQKMLAQLLRQQGDSAQQAGEGQGRMIGKHYVPDHWGQLASVLRSGAGAFMNYNADKAQGAMDQQAGAARSEWERTLPQGTPATPELPGPRDESGSPELNAQPAKLPSRMEILQATLRGMKIPGNEKAAEMWNRGMSDELTREDTQAARKDEKMTQDKLRRDQLLQQREIELEKITQRAEDARLRSEDTRLGIEQRREAAAAMAEARRQHSEMMGEIARIRADAAKEAANTKAAKLPAFVDKKLRDVSEAVTKIGEANIAFKPEYAGLSGAAKTAAGSYIPGVDTEAAEWWRNYKKDVQLAERHAMFGSALTSNEKASWRSADIEPYMNPEMIQKNLRIRAELAHRLFEKTREQFGQQGYQVDDAFPSLGPLPNPSRDYSAPQSGGADGSWGDGQQPVKVKSKAERDALPPGTPYIGPDGQPAVKQ